MMEAKRRVSYVAVVVDTTDDWGRAVVRGIGNYARAQGSWRIWIWAWGRGSPVRLPATWHGNGIIAAVYDHDMAHKLKAIKVPIVNISAVAIQDVNLPRVTTDMRAAARQAAEHLLSRGLRHFAYCGCRRDIYVQNYCQEFVTALSAVGHECRTFSADDEAGASAGADVRQRALTRWLKKLPKPVGMPLPTLAAMSGFSSPEYLARVFKRHIGLSPHKYRNTVNGL